MIDLILILTAIYALIGMCVALGFAFKGVNRTDPVAAKAPLAFRLMIVPGSAGLWPVVLVKWLRASRRGEDGPASGASGGVA